MDIIGTGFAIILAIILFVAWETFFNNKD